MKGTIISGEEVLKTIASGDLENTLKIYEIYKSGLTQIELISGMSLETVLKDCNDENIIFIKIEK